MRNITADDFSDKTGTSYDVVLENGTVPLTLKEFAPLTGSPREGGAFRLLFVGPVDPVLPQATLPFRQGDDEIDIFIVPIARDQAGTQYEAIFF